MSKIIKSRNLFLEKEELVRWDRFYQEDGLKSFMKNMISHGGIVPRAGVLGDDFKVIEGSTYKNISFVAPGTLAESFAYDTSGNRLYFKHVAGYEWGVPFTPGGTKTTWVYMQYTTTAIEEGTITLAINGALTGSGTKFTEVFRGSSTLVPNKIRIYSRVANSTGGSGYTFNLVGTYSVNEVTSDTSMTINAVSALGAGTYVYSVVGAFSPGTFDDSREEEIYQYDSVELVFSNTDPISGLTANQYMLCDVTVNDVAHTMVINDLRTDLFQISVLDDSFVQTTGDQTVSGIKTFIDILQYNPFAPVASGNQIPRMADVVTAIAAAIAGVTPTVTSPTITDSTSDTITTIVSKKAVIGKVTILNLRFSLTVSSYGYLDVYLSTNSVGSENQSLSAYCITNVGADLACSCKVLDGDPFTMRITPASGVFDGLVTFEINGTLIIT
jgi:hypothetical protein